MPVIALVLKYPLLNFLFNFEDIGKKAESIYAKHLNKENDFQYPYFGPFIFMISSYFMTAMGFKPFLAYIYLASNLLFSLASQFAKNFKSFLSEFKDSFVAISFVCFITFALPDYSYYKYFVFLLPVFLKDLIAVFGVTKILNALTLGNILTIITALFMLAR